MSHDKSLRAALGLAVLSVIWGYNWVVMKEALHFSGPFAFAALRCLSGAAALLIMLAILRRPLLPQSLWGALVLGLLQTAGFTRLATWALVQGGAGKIAVLVYTMPFWLLILAWPILGEHIRGLQWISIALAFSGLLLIIQPWGLQPHLFSIALALLAGFAWALSGIWIKRLQRQRSLDMLSLTAWQLLLGSMLLVPVALLYDPQPVNWAPYFIAALAYNALPATALSWWLFNYAVQNLPAGVAGMGTLFTPVIGVVAAWLQLGETPGSLEGIGILLIFTGLGVLSYRSSRS